jgi:hypothetical protein
MPLNSPKQLLHLCEIIPPLLSAIPETDFSFKPGPEKWSKKETLGHLLDSAANNHQRFVRVQFEKEPLIVYDQNAWNQYSYHQKMNSSALINMWSTYNKHLAELMTRIPQEHLQNKCQVGNSTYVTLAFLIEDYITHMEHHLRQIVKY